MRRRGGKEREGEWEREKEKESERFGSNLLSVYVSKCMIIFTYY